MLRSKKDVDRHVRDILNKVKSESERKLRGYNIARFYHNVGENELARRYLAEFLSVRPKAIDGHRLLGQIFESSGNKEKAVLAYKTAYELGDGQKDLLIKICELYSVVPCEASVRLHWAEEGQRLCPHHEAVTNLRTAIITRSSDTSSRHDLQQLYLDEIQVNPTSAEMQSNLVRLYLDWSKDEPRKMDEAYNYVAEVEARRPFSHSLTWYQTMLEVAEAYEKRGSPQSSGSEFKAAFLTGLERLVHLTLEAASTTSSAPDSNKTRAPYLTEAASLLRRFDIKLSEVRKANCDKELEAAMAGQLFFHFAQYLMISAKKLSAPLSPNTVSCLLLHACRFSPPASATSSSHYHRLACYRLSQSSHILLNMARDTNTTITNMLNKVRQQCSNRETKEEVFRAVFGGRTSTDQSYFMHHSDFVDAELTMPLADAVKEYDQVVSVSECSQLREIVWLCLQEILRSGAICSPATTGSSLLNLSNLNNSVNTSGSGGSGGSLGALVKAVLQKSQPFYPYTLFDGLQFATSHLSSAVPDSLCHLDLLAFLAATVYCQLETGMCSSNVRSAVCRTSVCSGWLLHSEAQDEWWTAAYNLYTNSTRRAALAKGLGKSRQIVQRGLEAIRLLSGGSVALPLALHVAHCFTHWANSASEDSSSGVGISEVTALEERAEHCWQQVLALCGRRAGHGGTPSSSHTPRNKMFVTTRLELSASEVERVEDEGRLFLALRLKKAGRRQEALQALGQLRSPDASFHRAMVYKQQANELLSAVSGDLSLLTPEQRGQHTLFLTQARDTLYLTLDRLRMPGVDRNHPLNAALSQELTSVERSLTNITVEDQHHLSSSYLGGDGSESVCEPLSPIRRGADHHDLTNGHEGSLDVSNAGPGATPARDYRATSTFRRLEARPSPERLDAQVRHLTSVQEQTLQNLCEQNAALRSHNSALRETCNTMAAQVKENTALFRSILEQNKTISMDCYNNILTEIKLLHPAIKELQEDVQKLKLDIADVKNTRIRKTDELDALTGLDALPGHPTPPPTHQGVLPNLYMSYYGGQMGAPHVPHPLASHPHMVAPPSSMFGGHHPHQPPFMPPATLTDPSFLAGNNGSMQLSRLLGGVTTSSGLDVTTDGSPATSRALAMAPQQLLAAHHQQQQHHHHQQQQQQDALAVTAAATAAAHYAAVAAAGGDVQQDSAVSSPQPQTAPPTGFSALPPLMVESRKGTASCTVSSTASSGGLAISLGGNAPHNYQIPLPASLLSSVTPPRHHTPERSPGVLPTSGLLASVPAPLYSAVTPDNSPLRPTQHSAASLSTARFSSSVSTVTSSLSGAGQSSLQGFLATTSEPAPSPSALSGLTGKVKTFPQRSQNVEDVVESILDTSGAVGQAAAAHNTNEYYTDDDHDPCPDFKPVVPLPEKVDVCTGEEDEQVLFEDRAKLYRMVSKEWKERGTGILKILHHCSKGTIRILMRRDQTHKICANHFISSTMELKKQQKNDNVWIWGAQDFADEALRAETFCCRFKTVEVATKFSRAFTEATQLASDYEKDASLLDASLLNATPEVVSSGSAASLAQPLSELFKKPPGNWACDTCLLSNVAEAMACVACLTAKPGAGGGLAASAGPAKAEAPSTGGFKFGLPSSSASATSLSTLPPARASGSIMSGVSGQATKPALFSTPTSASGGMLSSPMTAMFSTPVAGGTMFSTPSALMASSKSGIFSTPNAGYSPSIFGTPPQQSGSTSGSAGMFTTPVASTVDVSKTVIDSSSTTVSKSFFGTPNSSVAFSVAAPASSIFSTPATGDVTSSAAVIAPAKIAFGGFSFTTTPSIVPAQDKVKDTKPDKAEPKKESIFSSFTFGAAAGSEGSSSAFTFTKKEDAVADKPANTSGPISGMFSNVNTMNTLTFGAVAGTSPVVATTDVFKTKDVEAFKPKPLFGANRSLNNSKVNTTANADDSSEKVDEYEPEVHFEPVIPLPELVQVKTVRHAITSKSTTDGRASQRTLQLNLDFDAESTYLPSGEEDEEQLFCERAKLFRWAEATKEWKERGLGEIKILSRVETGKFRVLMRREKTLKICANHNITTDLKLAVRADSDKALTWAANDFSEGEMLKEKFTIKFKNPEIANEFKTKFENAQQAIRENADSSVNLPKETSAGAKALSKTEQQSLADKFRPAPGSWECDTCLVRNKADVNECLSCRSVKPGSVTVAAVSSSSQRGSSAVDEKTKSLAALFKPEAGSWECDVCLVRNKPSTVICVSCQTLKPGATAAEADKEVANSAPSSAFSFGVGSSTTVGAPAATTASSTGVAASAFKFGASSGASSTFSFGLPVSSTTSSPAAPASSTSGFSFKPRSVELASRSSSTAQGDEGPAGFKFGSPEKFEFSFQPRSRDVSQCESEDGVVEEDEGDHLYFEPIVPLPDKVDVVTGEEEEQVLYSHRAKLFRKAGPEWKERGIGDIKIMRHRQTQRLRLLMRREQVHKICLNHYLTKEIELHEKDEKSFYWVAQDFSEETPALETFAIRFKTGEIAQEFKQAAENAVNGVSVAVDSQEGSTILAGPATGGKGGSGAGIQQEASRVDRARRLLLPDNFYDYEDKECQCGEGCLGCRDDSLPPFLALETPPGNVLKDFPSESSTTSASTEKSVFGASSTSGFSNKPLFGSDSASSGSTATLSFGSAPSGSIFGGAAKPEQSNTGDASVFSAADKSATSSSLFGGPTVSSLFGGVPTSGSLFGGVDSQKSIFGGSGSPASSSPFANTASPKPSIFGGVPSATGSIFGGATPTTSSSVFGGASSGSIFGGTSAPQTTSSVFGGSSAPQTTSSVFGGSPAPQTPSSVFGGATASQATCSVFGGSSAPQTTASVFGGTTSSTGATESLFGGAAAETTKPSVFGGSSTFSFNAPVSSASSSEAKPSSLFGGAAPSTSVFGGSSPAPAQPSGSLFAGSAANESKGFISFSDFAASTGTDGSFSSKNKPDMSAWQAKPLFTSLNTSATKQSTDDSGDQLHQEDDSHDPHFEPVVPMPDLVEVKTGEEGLEVLYSHRSKTFRYDVSTKEWKERGVGDLKILYDPISHKYRLLQRREQIHKLAVHHYILPGQKLNPMALSETAWCWYAQDFSEDSQGTREQLAARFKNSDIAMEFKIKFEECVAKSELAAANTSGAANLSLAANVSVGAAAGTPNRGVQAQHYSSETEPDTDDDDEDDEDEDDDYVDSSIMYEKVCNLEKRLGEDWDDLGPSTLRLVFESDADGVRLMATSDGESGLLLADHLITKDLEYSDDGELTVTWAALDLSTQPACQVKLRASFEDSESRDEFCCAFEDGKDMADKSGHPAYHQGLCEGVEGAAFAASTSYASEMTVRACDPKLASALGDILAEMNKPK